MRPLVSKSSGQMATVSKNIDNALTLVLVVSLIESRFGLRAAVGGRAGSSVSARNRAVG